MWLPRAQLDLPDSILSISPILYSLIPVLLNGMVYEDKTVESLNGDKDYDSVSMHTHKETCLKEHLYRKETCL